MTIIIKKGHIVVSKGTFKLGRLKVTTAQTTLIKTN